MPQNGLQSQQGLSLPEYFGQGDPFRRKAETRSGVKTRIPTTTHMRRRGASCIFAAGGTGPNHEDS